MDFQLGDGWTVQPAGGATGEAYIAQQGEQYVFLKRNSSPFLAVLSAEGIVPKLLWTKRLENGDVVTAQKWIEGRELRASEMKERRVASLLAKIHGSSELLYMFRRIGNGPLTPHLIVQNLRYQLNKHNINHHVIERGIIYLQKRMAKVYHDQYVVCHCDINHNNWILDENEHLYLIDWDGATVSDPALDLGLLLYTYVPKEEWSLWLKQYGISLTDSLLRRMHWYVVSQSISGLIWHYGRNQFDEVSQFIQSIRHLITEVEF